MASYDFDLFVIGGGSGGVRAARMAASLGARVGIAESDRYGGTCVIRGCIPKKLLVYASHFHEGFDDAIGYGWTVDGARFDWPALIANKDREIARLEQIYEDVLDRAGVARHKSRAVLLDPHTVALDGRRVTAETILIATGGRPEKPAIPGADLGITSDEAFHLERLPEHIVILGGGYIALEFAGIFGGLGSKVSLVYRREPILRGFDDDVRTALQEETAKKGIDMRLGVNIQAVHSKEGRLEAELTDGSKLSADQVMFGTGRVPNVEDLGLDDAGVETDRHCAIKVDEYSRTTQPNIYAVGDVTNRLNLTPVAIHEAMAFVDTVFGGKPRAMEHAGVPSAVFSQPPVAVVGMTEADARREHGAIDVYRTRFRPLMYTMSGRNELTMMKLVVDRASQRVLGAHMVGRDAPEIIQGIAVAIKAGATKQVFDRTVGIHPTAAEEFVTMREPVPTPQKQAAE